MAGVVIPPLATPLDAGPLLGVRALGTHAAAAAAEDLRRSFSADAFTTALSASYVFRKKNEVFMSADRSGDRCDRIENVWDGFPLRMM